MNHKIKKRLGWWLGSALLLTAALYLVFGQTNNWQTSLAPLSRADRSDSLLAITAWLLTLPAAAAVYYFLRLRPLNYRATLLVALAGGFTNRLAPAGAGGITTYYLYLRRQRYTALAAASAITLSNLVGVAGHVSLLALAALGGVTVAGPGLPTNRWLVAAVAGAAFLGLLCIYQPSIGRWLQRQQAALLKSVRPYRQRPLRLALAYFAAIGLTVANVTCLYFCVQAVGITALTPATLLLVFSTGLLGATITPTPGGLGGAEAALAASLHAYQVAWPTALAAAVLFRLITYWLAFFAGGLALVVARRRGLF